MQGWLGVGLVGLVSMWLGACSEDPDGRRRMPLHAAVASAGGASAGGSAGVVGSAGAPSAAGGAAEGMLSAPPCSGCVEMVVPVDPAFRDANGAQNLAAMYNFVFPMTGLDLSNATVTWSISTLTPGAEFYVTPYAQNAANLNYAGVYRPETALTEANGFNATGSPFVPVVLDLANTAPAVADALAMGSDAGDTGAPAAALLANNGMDKSRIWQLGLRIGAQTRLAAPATIRVLVDQVTIVGVEGGDRDLRSRDFSDGPEELMVNTFMLPAGSTGPTQY